MINRVVLVGRLARDPFELRKLNNNGAVISFTLAVDKPNRKDGTESQADFITIKAFNRLAENVELYYKKGMLVGVDGRISTNNYEDRNGNRVYQTEVVADSLRILETKGSRENTVSNDPIDNPHKELNKEQAESTSTNEDIGLSIKDDDIFW